MRGNDQAFAGGWIRYQEEEPVERVYWVPSIVPTRSSESGVFFSVNAEMPSLLVRAQARLSSDCRAALASAPRYFLSATHGRNHPRDVDARITELT